MIDFELRSLPLLFQIPNNLTKTLGVTTPHLTPENLIKAASKKANLPAKFPIEMETALEVLCRSIADEAKLHWFGKMNYLNMIVTGLSGYLQVEQAFIDNPALAETKLLDPLIVMGLPRSGTTFLHRLLSSPENNQGIEMYRFMFPTAGKPDLRSLSTFAIFEPWKIASGVYNMDAIHYMRPNLPDECNFGLRLTMQTMLFWSMAPTYSYLRWLLDRDLKFAYQFYRKLLIIYQQQLPNQRLTLKCPYHIGWINSLVEAIPEAKIVNIHRDPLQTMASDCKLTLSLHGLATDNLDAQKVVDHVYLKNHAFTQRIMAFASSFEGHKILHVKYQDLVKDPLNFVRHIYEEIDLPLDDRDQEMLEQYVLNNKKNKHGRNSYSLEQFNLSENKMTIEFKDYCDRFIN